MAASTRSDAGGDDGRPRPPIVMLGTFGLRPKGTMSARALPLGQALVRRGWRVRLVLPPWDHPDDAGTRQVLDGVEVVNVGLQAGPAAIVARMVAASRTWEATAVQPLVHCFKPKGYGGLAALVLATAGWPLVVDSDDWDGPGGWNDRLNYGPLARRLFAWQWRSLPRRARRMTVASRYLEAAAHAAGQPADAVHYLPNGLADWRHLGWQTARPVAGQRARLGLGAGPVAVLYTRFDTVTPERVLAWLMAARRRLPTLGLLVVGSGPAGEEHRLASLAAAAGFGDAVRLAGFVPFRDLPATLHAADFAVYLIDDGLINRSKAPMKLLELMALGLPIAAEAVGETPAYLAHGQAGLLVPAGDERALVEATVRLVESQPDRQRYAAAARERAWATYNWTHLVEQAEAVYQAARDTSGTR